MQLLKNHAVPIAEVLSGRVLEHSPAENDEESYSSPVVGLLPKVSWIDETLELFVAMFNWRTTPGNLKTLSALWAKNFRGWRLSQSVIDRAIELAQKNWRRIPDNVTQAFAEFLCDAQNEATNAKRERDGICVKGALSEGEKEFNARTQCMQKIKNNFFADEKWDMPLAKKIAAIFGSYEITAAQQHPGASEIEMLRAVWRMI